MSPNQASFEIRVDLLQKVHTIFNYIYVLQTIDEPNNEHITRLTDTLRELENKYTSAFDETKMRDEFKLKDKINEVGHKFIKVNLIFWIIFINITVFKFFRISKIINYGYWV